MLAMYFHMLQWLNYLRFTHVNYLCLYFFIDFLLLFNQVKCSGFLDLVEKGDCFAADKGVLIRSELAARGAMLKAPPRKLKGQKQFSADAAMEVTLQAKVRIHVER